MGDRNGRKTRRSVLRTITVGGVVAGGTILGGTNVAEADLCDFEVDGDCVEVIRDAEAYVECPSDGSTTSTTVNEGQIGTLRNTCTDEDGNCYVEFMAGCATDVWVRSEDVGGIPDSNCFC